MNAKAIWYSILIILCLVFWVGVFTIISWAIPKAHAESINVERLATAIYYAEGGVKTNHPYGILSKYKSTTPRQACINTINHALRDWNGKGDFISWIGSRYCPVGAKNDPRGLNRNWISNVRRIYER